MMDLALLLCEQLKVVMNIRLHDNVKTSSHFSTPILLVLEIFWAEFY